jgi:hypothetical protein
LVVESIFVILLAASILVSILIFKIAATSEETDFQHQFEAQAVQLEASFNKNVELKLGAMETLALAFTSHALDKNAKWPLVTLPDFAPRALSSRELADALSVGIMPVVQSDERRLWEQYTRVNSAWIPEGLAFENQTYTEQAGTSTRRLQAENVPDFSQGFASTIYKMEPIEAADGPISIPQIEDSKGAYLPIWQNSGVVRALVNYNLDSNVNFTDSIQACLQSEKAVMSRVTDLSRQGPLATSVLSIWEKYAGVHYGDPFSVMNFPVFDSFDGSKTLVGIVFMVTYWSSYFDGVLTEDGKGIIVVVENECEQTYTYEVNAGDVTFVGIGDLHDENFDHLEYTTTPVNIEL